MEVFPMKKALKVKKMPTFNQKARAAGCRCKPGQTCRVCLGLAADWWKNR